MNINGVDDDGIRVEHSSDRHNPKNEDSRQNQRSNEETKKVINQWKTRPMHPTPLYVRRFFLVITHHMTNTLIREYPFWSTHPITMAVCSFSLFTILAVLVGVLTVCLTKHDNGTFFSFCYTEVVFF